MSVTKLDKISDLSNTRGASDGRSKLAINLTCAYFSVATGPSTFGYVHIILPSAFSGANLDIRHGDEAKHLNLAHQSGLSTSIVASYSGVSHTLAPVETGYRVCLSYRLTQPLSETLPALPDMQGAAHKLELVLRSWKQATSDETPSVLACLLQHEYSHAATLRVEALKGVDKLLASQLLPMARKFGFRLYPAHLEYSICGSIDIPRRFNRWGELDSDDDYSELDPDDFEPEDSEDTVKVVKIFDLDGMPSHIPHLDLTKEDIVGSAEIEDGHCVRELDRYDEVCYEIGHYLRY